MEEELLKYLVGVVSKAVPSLQLPLVEQPFLQLQIPVAIIEGSFKGTAQDLIGLRYL